MTKSIVGQKFGRLTVVERIGSDIFYGSTYKCLCECGNYTRLTYYNIVSGHTKSCGCLKEDNAKNIHKYNIVNGTSPANFKKDAWTNLNTSGFRGVYPYRQSGKTKYIANIVIQGKVYKKKGFKTPEEAYEYRLELEEKYLKPVLEEIERIKNNPS